LLTIYITNNCFLYFGKKVPVRRTGAYRHIKALQLGLLIGDVNQI